jgi:hypothetical protein|tara:strand:- start:139 stop:699 length:561 start_codon:yes stop_codon:yes gene_type:complete
MGKNLTADICDICGGMMYYGGECVECFQEPQMNIGELREFAIQYIHHHYNRLKKENLNFTNIFKYIWYASTEILPNLEIQVVLDSNEEIHVSTGSAGYVDFQFSPAGMKLPVMCWIHTHPFGSAYFSGTDWRTVNTWQKYMLTAFVLGGVNHYGYWENHRPERLLIVEKNSSIREQMNPRMRREEE